MFVASWENSMPDNLQAGIGGPMKILSLPGILTALVAVGIIFIGIRELFYPGAAAMGFGVRLSDPGDGDFLAIKAARPEMLRRVFWFLCFLPYANAESWPTRLAH
jgi:hypothetical protein